MYSDKNTDSIILPFSCQVISFFGDKVLPILSKNRATGVTVIPAIKLKYPNKKEFFKNEPYVYERLQDMSISLGTKDDPWWKPFNEGITFAKCNYIWDRTEDITIDNQPFVKARPYQEYYDVFVPINENFVRTSTVKSNVIALLSKFDFLNYLDVDIEENCENWRVVPTTPSWKIPEFGWLDEYSFMLNVNGISNKLHAWNTTALYGDVIVSLKDISIKKKIPFRLIGKCIETILLQWRLDLMLLYFANNKGDIKRVKVNGGTYGGIYKYEGEFGILRKVPKPGTEEEVENEIRMSDMFQHNNIIKYIYTVNKKDVKQIAWPEYKMDCFDYMKNNPTVDRKISFSFIRDLFSALVEIHKLNIIHRDIKPNNCFINLNPPILVLADFGVATEVSKLPDLIIPGIEMCRAPETYGPSGLYDDVVELYDTKIDIFAASICVVLELFTRKDVYVYKLIYAGKINEVDLMDFTNDLHKDMNVFIPNFIWWIHPKPEMRYTAKECYDQIMRLI